MESSAQPSSRAGRVSAWNARHPVFSLVLVSLLAVIINCHPLLFLGRSLVSPACTGILVYPWPPFFPGLDPGQAVSVHGSDNYATMAGEVPAGFIESRSLLQNGELPLWNRYGHAGSTFIGQAIYMLGDPLQLIVICGRGSAWAWDIKFLTAKFLFCLGFGLLVWRLVGSQRLALVFAALAAYCGAFYYVNNHPVFFVFCYAPWILLCALQWLDPRNGHGTRWALAWLLANFACFNAGHVEVAVILIGGLNFVALAATVASVGWSRMAPVVGRMSLGTLAFLGLTAPVWMSFLGALAGSYSVHTEAHVYQLPVRSLPGAFDDLLYLLLVPGDAFPAIAPCTGLLVLAGCVLSVLHWRQSRGERFFWINLAALAVWGGCIFGWIPGPLLNCIPLLNRDGHTFTDFSYLLVLHLTLQCAYGFKTLSQGATARRAATDLLAMALVVGGMLLGYNYSLHHRPVPWNYFLLTAAGAVGAPAMFVYLKAQGRARSLSGWLVILLLAFAAQFRFGLYGAGNRDLLLLVGPRLQLDAPSPAIEKIQRDASGPFRVDTLHHGLYGDYAAVYGLEDIRSCAPLTSGDYLELTRSFPGFDFSYQWVLEVTNVAAAQPLLNLLNVKYILAPTNIVTSADARFRVTDRSDFAVLENLDVWPRAFFTDKVIPADSVGEFIHDLEANAQTPLVALAPAVIRSEPGLQALADGPGSAMVPATNYRLLANSTAFDIHAPAAGVVCLTEGQARSFTATANGEARPVLTVNRAFKGLYLDRPGDYHIIFTYRPWHWRLACALFWLAFSATAVWTLAKLYRPRGKTNPRK
jgi:hypothetical protein